MPARTHAHSRAADSLESAVRRELPILYRFATRLAGPRGNPEDLVGRALLQCAKAWDRFDGQNARAWMLKVLRNEHLQEVRRKTLVLEPPEAMEHAVCHHMPVSAQAMRRIALEQINEEIANLPLEFREALVLCDVEEVPYKEAATILDIPLGTLSSRLHRARHMLRNALAGTIPIDTEAP